MLVFSERYNVSDGIKKIGRRFHALYALVKHGSTSGLRCQLRGLRVFSLGTLFFLEPSKFEAPFRPWRTESSAPLGMHNMVLEGFRVSS